jgi:lysylphosphatidylglycerol synthetase-like protein (DUF2156 family)
VDEVLRTIEALAPVAALRTSGFAYPVVSALHILGIALLIGPILLIDLALLNVWRGGVRAGVLVKSLTPVAVAGFCLAAATGLALFAVRASHYAANEAWQIKMALIAAALINALLFWQMTAKEQIGSLRIKLPAAASMLFWVSVLFAGRFIAFIGE